MATPSQVKAGLDDIAVEIRTQRANLVRAAAQIQAAQATLAALPTKYEGVVTTIQGYDGSDPAEAVEQADLARLTTEFQALRTKAQSAVTALEGLDFSS